MSIALLLIALAMALPHSGYTQNENANWIFGHHSGLYFGIGGPSVTSSSHATPGASAAISDASGDLLFYAEHHTLWRADHQLMVNGDSLNGSWSTPQAGIIIPGGPPHHYYVIRYRGTAAPEHDGSHYYHVVDMAADGGHGAVVAKNVLLRSSTTSCTAGIPAGDGGSYWLVLHDWGSDAWLAYRVDEQGLDTIPVVSHAGEVHYKLTGSTAAGTLKASSNGSLLALTKTRYSGTDARIELFSFDVSTGMVSDPIRLEDNDRFVSAEFSPSGQFLYVSNMRCGSGTFSELLQFDVSSGDSATIVGSRTVIHQEPYHPTCDSAIGHLALGIDGRIYVNVAWTPLLGVIHQPDQPGTSCLYDPYGFDTGFAQASPAMPNFVKFPAGPLSVRPIAEELRTRLHPNPFHTTARLWLPRAPHGPVTLRWHDAQGRLLHQEQQPAQQVLDLHRGALPGGLLLLSARDARGDLARLKVVVE